jgi:hypothetical protein
VIDKFKKQKYTEKDYYILLGLQEIAKYFQKREFKKFQNVLKT